MDTDLTEGDNLDQLIFLFEISFITPCMNTCYMYSLKPEPNRLIFYIPVDTRLYHMWACNIQVHIWYTYIIQWSTYMAIDLKPEMLLYQFKTPTLTNSFYMIIMTESSCNVKYIYFKQYVPLSMYTLVLDAETAPGFIYLQAPVLSSD